ncbi:MAG: DDE-type integrase/transposase/recombinase [Rhodospirillales bacterium]|nr:DDE-type integrase/transposase/recombinase [Acetobacter sp.]
MGGQIATAVAGAVIPPAVTGITLDRVTTDGHDSYPRAIKTELGDGVRHRTSRYLHNRMEQDHRGLKGRY